MERRRLWNARSANGTTWNYLELFGTPEGQLEQPQASGTRFSANGTPQALACSLAPYPYSKMCELCELCELFVKKLLLKTVCAILPDCALFTL